MRPLGCQTHFGNNVIGDWEREDLLLLDQVQLADGTPVTEVRQIDTNADGLLNGDDDSSVPPTDRSR